MKKDLHPEMMKSMITCACGAKFETVSNKDAHTLEVCNNCHPAYNENIRTTHKKTGAVEKFNRKFNLNQEQTESKPKKAEAKITEPVAEEPKEEPAIETALEEPIEEVSQDEENK